MENGGGGLGGLGDGGKGGGDGGGAGGGAGGRGTGGRGGLGLGGGGGDGGRGLGGDASEETRATRTDLGSTAMGLPPILFQVAPEPCRPKGWVRPRRLGASSQAGRGRHRQAGRQHRQAGRYTFSGSRCPALMRSLHP